MLHPKTGTEGSERIEAAAKFSFTDLFDGIPEDPNEGPPSAIITQERNSGIVGDPALSEGTGMTSDSLEDPWYSGQSVPTDTVFAPEPAEADWFPEESAPR